ncbi:hypothetical protein NX059_010673 [Plenodomus lindquistii]|nr:hypothetical protein NX059_010673 [Plenodomus lindquistii]
MPMPLPTHSAPTPPVLAYLFRAFVQLLAGMWDYSLRFGFGPRAPTMDEEASAPLLAADAGSLANYGAASASDSSRGPTRPDLETMLAPIHVHLEKLKSTTPASRPPYNPRIRTASHAQVIKTRLLAIGAFIVADLLAQEPEADKGLLELDICRHIATHYWPLPVTYSTHLHVLEIYRNAQYKLADQPCQSAV